MSTKLFDETMLGRLQKKAEASARRRANHNVHVDYDDPVQRLFITIYPDSYVRPHKHSLTDKWEFFWMVTGQVSFLVFSEQGEVIERHELSATGPMRGLEIPANTWHAVVPGEQPATFFEVKTGPYVEMDDKDFATWAPAEQDETVADFLKRLKSPNVGQKV